MTIAAGDHIPEATLIEKTADGPAKSPPKSFSKASAW